MIVDKIGLPAVLEQCAEECAEFTAICLKMARKLRGENPTPKTFEEIRLAFMEEMSDATLCMDVISEESDLTYADVIESTKEYKMSRWINRIKASEEEAGETNELS